MFAKGSKSSGGSRGFSLEWLEKYSAKSALTSIVSGLQIFMA